MNRFWMLVRRLFRKPKHDPYLVLNIVAFNRPKIYYK